MTTGDDNDALDRTRSMVSEPGDAIQILTRDRDEWKARCLRAEKSQEEMGVALYDLREEWTEDDKPLPEDTWIENAHPFGLNPRADKHEVYREAMRMVGAKRSKYALVDLVNWLLCSLRSTEEKYKDQIEGPEGTTVLRMRLEAAEKGLKAIATDPGATRWRLAEMARVALEKSK